MSEEEATKLLNCLIEKQATQVQDWLKSIWQGKQHIPENFNWAGLAAVASDKARGSVASSGEGESPNLEWAKVAVSVYDFLAATHPDMKHSFSRDAMMLRAYTISKMGHIPGDPILDGSCIVNWFLNNLRFSPKEALSIALSWKDLVTHKYQDLTQNQQKFAALIEEVRELRQIKNQLLVIQLLSQNNQFNLDEEMNTWLSIQQQLP
ncbi:hypothetical protein NUACC21_26380 [Scytonema sp. NUACC21]